MVRRLDADAPSWRTSTSRSDRNLEDFRFPVQFVNRPNLNFRGFCGTIASGIVRKGDEVMALPSRKTSRVKSIVTYRRRAGRSLRAAVGHAHAGRRDRRQPRRHARAARTTCRRSTDKFDATVVWMTEEPLVPGKQYWFKQTIEDSPPARSARCATASTSTRSTAQDAPTLELNEIGRCHDRAQPADLRSTATAATAAPARSSSSTA